MASSLSSEDPWFGQATMEDMDKPWRFRCILAVMVKDYKGDWGNMASEIARRLGVDSHYVSKYLSILKKRGLVKFEQRNPKRAGRWHLTEKIRRRIRGKH